MTDGEESVSNTIVVMSRDQQIEVTLETWLQHVYPPSLIGITFAQEVSKLPLQGKSVLDLGCGSGLIGICAALCGAEVTCTDINEAAVANTVHNATLNDVRIESLISDAYDSIGSRRFDIIVANCPLPDLSLFRKVLHEGIEHVEDNGLLMMWATSAFDVKRCESMMFETWDCVEVLREIRYDFYKIGIVDGLDIDSMVGAGFLENYGPRKISTARWYSLSKL
jgi:2-polyprenyl-3-methyl-5-hydroxy-6-metoxy-1,4-benzoquinol methylase